MAPEYGATMGFFPVDGETIRYLRQTGRDEETCVLVEAYCKEQHLWAENTPDPSYTDLLELDLSTVRASMAGPKRPQDRVLFDQMKPSFEKALTESTDKRGFGLGASDLKRTSDFAVNSHHEKLGHGAVVIAAITSCTNTSNPSVMLAAGLLAKKAVERGLTRKPWVKSSLAPGSPAVTSYLDKAGLSSPLDKLGFQTVGYGCTTCIGNSGPLPDDVSNAITKGDLVAAAVLSGNRNFEGRVHPLVKANYLASPPLVVAYAIAGRVDIDLTKEPIGTDKDGKPVLLKEIWPSNTEIRQLEASIIEPSMFREKFKVAVQGNDEWKKIAAGEGQIYQWNDKSTYIQEPPFFTNLALEPSPTTDIKGARVLLKLGDSITTDHISPAGSIKADSPAGRFLREHGVEVSDFNSYGSRRGNDRIMTRGTFANIRIRNQVAPGTEGGVTLYLPTNEQMAVYDAAMKYKADGTPLIVLAGAEYGSGSSRDWAAKGTILLGIKAVIASSFERIHRANLVGMGVLPLEFLPGQSHQSLGLSGREVFDISGIATDLKPLKNMTVRATAEDGKTIEFEARCRIDTPVEVDYYRNGGILQTVLRKFAKEG
jgi:aconitate hydratase